MGDVSQLPLGIILHILSDLKTKEAIRTSLFCKAWHSASLTRPNLNFGDSLDDASLMLYGSGREEKYLKFVKNILQRYKDERTHIAQLVLPMILSDSLPASLVDKWIGTAVDNGVEKLQLYFYYRRSSDQPPYTLPSTIFEGNTLRELTVRGFSVETKQQIGEKVMFILLQKLQLLYITIDDDTFRGILTRCPLISDLCVSSCRGLERIKVTDLDNLKKFTVCTSENQYIEIKAPRLQYLDCELRYGGTLDHLYTTQKLKYFSLAGEALPPAIFSGNFMRKFPQTKDLRLYSGSGLETINISSDSLKSIVLGSRRREGSIYQVIKEVKIDAPNMASLELHLNAESIPNLSLDDAPTLFVSKIFIYNC